MLLLPLYYQAVRGETPLGAGLLMAPQGIGAAIMMPFAGRATDRVGPGRVVLGGLALATLGTIPFTKVGAHTSYALLAGSLVVRGLGLGATMMPAMAGAYQTLDHDSVARATSALNAIMRVGGSIGTAVLAVVLQHRLRGGFAAPPTAARNPATVANAFGGTFAWGLGLMALGFIPAIFLPRRRPAPESAPEPPVAPDLAEPPSHARHEPAQV
jgi:MFS family permease